MQVLGVLVAKQFEGLIVSLESRLLLVKQSGLVVQVSSAQIKYVLVVGRHVLSVKCCFLFLGGRGLVCLLAGLFLLSTDVCFHSCC